MPVDLPVTPARLLALAIGVPVVSAVIGYTSLSYVALAGQDSYRVQPGTAPPAAMFSAAIGSGDISIGPSPDRRTHLAGVVNYSLVRPSLSVTTTGAGVVLSGPNCFWVGNCGAEIILAVPSGEAVKASSGSGNVTVKGVGSALSLSVGSGNITAAHLSGALVLKDSSGDIAATALASARVRAYAGSGNVNLSFSRPPDELTISDSSGDITVTVPAGVAYDVTADASSGTDEVKVPTDPSSRRRLHLDAGSGNILVLAAPSGF